MSAPVIIPAYAERHADSFEAIYRAGAMRLALALLEQGQINAAAETLRKAMVFEVEQAA